MTDTELNEALARWAGKDGQALYPDYCNDLNAMATLEAKLDLRVVDERSLYYDYLLLVTPGWPNKGKYADPFEMDWKILRATARQRAEALARTVGVWKEAP